MIGVARRVHNETVLCLIKVSVWKMHWFLLGKYVDNDFYLLILSRPKSCMSSVKAHFRSFSNFPICPN